MNIDVSLSLNERPQEYKDGLFQHMERNKPFVLFEDKEHYAMFYPAELLVECNYGNAISRERMKNAMTFQLRLAVAVVAYSAFESLVPKRPMVETKTVAVEIKVPKYLTE